MDLSGKTALVTGAGRGFGWGIAKALARAGANVCVTDIIEEDIATTVQEIKNEGHTAVGAYLDVSQRDMFNAVVADMYQRWGRVDILVHNAIYMPLITFEDTTPELWQKQLDVSLGGLYNGTKAVWDIMKQQKHGHIIGIASGSSLRGFKEEVTYCAAKHAQEGFMKALALELQGTGIAVNTMGPGKPIKTTRITREELAALPEQDKAAWADPADLGRAFVWLASQDTDVFNGLRFDAGQIVDTLNAEGDRFIVTPEKVTLYPDDFKARQDWARNYQE